MNTAPVYDCYLWIARWADSSSCETIIARTEDEALRYARVARGSNPNLLVQQCEVYSTVSCGIVRDVLA